MPIARDQIPVRVGETLVGKYLVERILGAGGMGVVVAARHLQLGELVALKFMLPEALKQGDAVARFLREARAAARLKGEHVARVTDVGTLDSGAPYMVMEYLEGSDLGALLAKVSRLTVEDAVEYLLQACEALGQAHALGIVHRDLKPANLFLTQRPNGSACLKVLDFGISKAPADAGDAAMTKTSVVMGTPLYMSPEQMRSSRSVDARGDIWSLGVILFELLAGRPPFDAEGMTELCALVLVDSAPPLRSVRSDVSKELEALVARCLEKDPARRYQSIAELGAALAKCSPGSRASAEWLSRDSRRMPATVALGPLMAASSPTVVANTAAPWGQTKPATESGKPNPAVVAGIAVGIALLAATAIVVVKVRGGATAADERVSAGLDASSSASPPTAPALVLSASSAASPPEVVPAPATAAASASGAAPEPKAARQTVAPAVPPAPTPVRKPPRDFGGRR